MAAAGIAVGALQNGQLEAAVSGDDTGDPGGVVGAIGLELTGVQGLAERLALHQEIADGVGLIAVGNNQIITHLADGVIDDQAGINHLGGIVSFSTDAVLGFGENAIAGIFAAAHDEIGGDSVLIVSGAA